MAKQAYRTCVVQDPSFAVGCCNLADVQEARGKTRGAVQTLTVALQMAPSFADAHFNLAVCLQKIGREEETSRHWKAFLKLDPNSQWAEVARRQLAMR